MSRAQASRPALSLRQLLQFAAPLDRLCLAVGALLALLLGFSWNLLTVAFGDAVDVFVRFEHARRLNASASASEFTRDIRFYGFSLVALWLFNSLFNFLLLLLFPLAAQRQIARIKVRYVAALLRQDAQFFDESHAAGDLASRINSDLKRVEDGLGEKLGLAIYHVATAGIALATAFVYGWELTLVIVSLLPLLAFGTSVMNKVQATVARKEAESYAAAGVVAQEAIGAVRTVKAFGRAAQEVARYAACLAPSLRSGVRRHVLTGAGNGLMFGCLYGGLALGVHFGVRLLLAPDSRYSLGAIVIVFWCVSGSGFSIGAAAPHFEAVRVAMATAAHVFHVIHRAPKIDAWSERGQAPEHVRAELEFRDVHFRYPTRPDVPVLSGFSLRVAAGESVALVGPSGSGKSTVVQLVQRFYDPQEGHVLIDGVDARDWRLSHLRKHVAAVHQEPQLFDASLEENVRLGSRAKLVTQTDVEAKLREANAQEFVQRLPQGLETRVGPGGAQLSGGQKQRVAIARALIAEPRILLLDEATSALDLEAEARVQVALERAARGRTTLVVAHRLSTVTNCDRIAVVRNGRVHELGSHAQLMAQRGIYYEMVTRQSLQEAQEGSEPEADAPPPPTPREETAPCDGGRQEGEELAGAEVERAEAEFPSWRLWRMLLLDRWLLLAGLLLSLLYGLVVPIYAFVFGRFVAVFAEAQSPMEVRARSHVVALYYVLIAVGVAVISVAQMTLLGVAGERLTLRLRRLAFEAILRQEVTWFDRPENACGALCARLSSDAAHVQGASGSRVAVVLQALSTFLASALLGLWLNWPLAVVAGLFTPLILVGAHVSASFDALHVARARKGQERATQVALEALTHVRTVQALQKEKHFVDRFSSCVRHEADWRRTVLRALTLSQCLSVVFLAYAVVFLFGGHLARQNNLRSSDFFVIIETLIYGAMTVGQSAVFTADYRKAKAAARHIFRLLDRAPQESRGHVRPSALNGHVLFRDVQFAYPARATPVLQGVSLEVRPGETVALVGASGSGKSTSVQLLQKFYELPADGSRGQITLDGVPLHALDTDWLRAQMALVSQEPALFSRSIRENIEFGARDPDHVAFADVVRAAQRANIHAFVSELPRAYDTCLGASGAQLSGGQRQRLAIARALIREPRVLLLDEATSALDNDSEKLVQMALQDACVGRACLVIAHRLSTVRHAHRIVVLERGRVREQGTHDELVALKGAYSEMVARQQI